MKLTRRGLASALVALLFLGCAASPNTGGIAPESGTAAERNRAAMERPADPIAYLHLVRAHYYAEAAEWPQAVTELRKAIDRDPKSASLWHLLARWLGRLVAHANWLCVPRSGPGGHELCGSC